MIYEEQTVEEYVAACEAVAFLFQHGIRISWHRTGVVRPTTAAAKVIANKLRQIVDSEKLAVEIMTHYEVSTDDI